MASGPLWGLPAGQGDWEDLWRGWGTQWPPLPPALGAYPLLPCCGLLPAPSLSLLAQPVWASCELCRWPPSPPSRAASEASWRAKAASGASGSAGCRESTGALKAWLGRHRQNPYPTKGEKVLLALLSRMSLTQVSTWFANARRRLKKERRPHPHPGPAPHDAPTSPAHQPRRQQEDDEEEEEEEEEEQPPRKQAKIWSLAELAAPAAAPAAPGIQQ